jgi:hypothetical protein
MTDGLLNSQYVDKMKTGFFGSGKSLIAVILSASQVHR